MGGGDNRLEWLYLINSTILITHEIDSAYWHEWTLLSLPGGVQLFLLLHLPLLMAVLYGYREVTIRGRYRRIASMALACVGLFAVLLHGVFIGSGNPAFTLPVSLGLLIATMVFSLMQLVTALQNRGAVDKGGQ